MIDGACLKNTYMASLSNYPRKKDSQALFFMRLSPFESERLLPAPILNTFYLCLYCTCTTSWGVGGVWGVGGQALMWGSSNSPRRKQTFISSLAHVLCTCLNNLLTGFNEQLLNVLKEHTSKISPTIWRHNVV